MVEQINQILNEKFDKLPKIGEMYKQFVSQTDIEKFGMEDFVMKALLAGKTKGSIVTDLKMVHPEGSFDNKDIDRFIERNKEFGELVEKKNNQLARRHFKAKVEIEEKLDELVNFTNNLVQEYDKEGDRVATVNAIRALNLTLMNLAKVSGFFEESKGNQTIVPIQNVVNIVSEKHESLANRVHNADFKIVEEKDG